MSTTRTLPCSDRDPVTGEPANPWQCRCGMCCGTYCARHIHASCDCDVVDRHEAPLYRVPEADVLVLDFT